MSMVDNNSIQDSKASENAARTVRSQDSIPGTAERTVANNSIEERNGEKEMTGQMENLRIGQSGTPDGGENASPRSLAAKPVISERHLDESKEKPANEDSDLYFIRTLKSLLLKGDCNFPLRVKIESGNGSDALASVAGYDPSTQEIRFSRKDLADETIPRLIDWGIDFTFDYTGFISHPGNLFIKNLSNDLIDQDELFRFFNGESKYKSLESINVFSGADDDVFAILKFTNYLDVDFLISNLDVTHNPFNHNKGIPLYLNKYISKKERKMKHNDNMGLSDSLNNYCSVIVENLSDFLNDHGPNLDMMRTFLSKFQIFNKIDDIYIPILPNKTGGFDLLKFGFISFETNEHVHVNVLKCLYYLNDLLFDEFMNFTKEDIFDIEDDVCKDFEENSSNVPKLKISIAQHKHNHFLYQFLTNQALGYLNGELLINYLDAAAYNHAINAFSRYINYQETNIYVNNFPIVFENNDALWEKFWLQFGNNIKSAKIIKPQFYTKKNEVEVGKIGFVFYKDFKMALRAILLTNNKMFNYPVNHKILVQTSFAIQKNNHNGQKHSLPTPYFPVERPQLNFTKRFSLPPSSDFNYYLSPRTPTMAPLASPSPYCIPQGSPDFLNYYDSYVVPVGYTYYGEGGSQEAPLDSDVQPSILNYGYFPYYQFQQAAPAVPIPVPNTKSSDKPSKSKK